MSEDFEFLDYISRSPSEMKGDEAQVIANYRALKRFYLLIEWIN